MMSKTPKTAFEEEILKANLTLTEMPPEYIELEKFSLLRIADALKIGLENTEQILTEHEANLGRTTRKNRTYAEQLEQEIVTINAALQSIIINIKG
jgi:hypothetical protein